MATRKYNGHKHHSRRHQSSDQMNRRRLSKQEEIDLTLEAIDLKEEAIDGTDKCNHFNANINNNESTNAPTIQVNAVDDKLIVEKDRNEKREDMNELSENCSQTMHKSDSDSGQSLGVKSNFKPTNSLSTEDNREKKRGKHLTRAEAVRDSSASPPPTQLSDSDEKSSNVLVVSSNSQSQIGSSMNSQSHKNKMKAQGSSTGSLDRSSPCLSRDSSTENYSDLTGTDVQQFLIETLQKNKKDRVFLLKIEQELNILVKDSQKTSNKFPQMTSYNRMLVHRVAALFGFEHNVDSLGLSVVVNKSKNTRIPDLKFKDYIKEDLLHEPKKSILKRDSASLEDNGSNGSQISFDGKEKSPDRQTGNLSDGPRSKSFEEREERYEKARARIFNQDSSSSTEGNDGSSHAVADTNCANSTNSTNSGANQLMQRNSSPRSSQSTEDLTTKPNNWTTSEGRAWSSTESDSSGRLPKNESKPIQQTVQIKANNCDSDVTPKSTPLSSSSSGGASLLTPEGSSSETSNAFNKSKNRPTVTKASSFGGISRNADNNYPNSTQTHLSKSGSFNVTPNGGQPHSGVNVIHSNRAITPKNNAKQEYHHKQQMNQTVGTLGSTHHLEPQQRYVSSQPPSQHHLSSTSHHNRHNWHQNQHSRSNNRMASIGSSVQWPPIVNQNFPHFLLQQQQSDSNINHMKEPQYLQQSGQQFYVSSLPNYGQQTINNEPQQHLTQQPIRLIYPNPNQSQPQLQSNLSSFGALVNGSVAHQSVSNQMSSVPFPLQSSHFSTNQSNIQNNALISGPLQVPSNVGTVWIINNGVQPQSSSPMMACPAPANTPPSASIGSNIAPFVGMSYQHYRPTINSNPNLNPNMSLSAAPNRGPNPLLKNQPLLATQANNTQRIMSSNGNHFIPQQMSDLTDMSGLLSANNCNNYLNRAPVVPQMSQLRRMPMNSQGLDVRLVGSQASPPFLLPTPQRPYFPVSNAVSVNHQRYANHSNANSVRQSKNSFSKHKPQRYNTNNRNILVPNPTANYYNT